MSTWFNSLRFRLVLAFAGALALALGSVSLYAGVVAERQAEAFERRQEQARAARATQFLERQYGDPRGWADVQAPLEQASALHGARVILRDAQGRMIADSDRPKQRPPPRQPLLGTDPQVQTDPPLPPRSTRDIPILRNGQQIGAIGFAPSTQPGNLREPPTSRLVLGIRRSLVWTGLLAGGAGILMVGLVSQRILAPVSALGRAARRVGQGDLSQRVPDLPRVFERFYRGDPSRARGTGGSGLGSPSRGSWCWPIAAPLAWTASRARAAGLVRAAAGRLC